MKFTPDDKLFTHKQPVRRFDGNRLVLGLDEVIEIACAHTTQGSLMHRLDEFEKIAGVDLNINFGFVTIVFEDDASMMDFYLRWMPTK